MRSCAANLGYERFLLFPSCGVFGCVDVENGSSLLTTSSRWLVIFLVGLLEQKVGRILLVLVARKVSLDDLIPGETEPAESLNSITLLLGDLYRGCTGRKSTALAIATFLNSKLAPPETTSRLTYLSK